MPTAAGVEAKFVKGLPKVWAAFGRDCYKVVNVGSTQDPASGSATTGTPTDMPITATAIIEYEKDKIDGQRVLKTDGLVFVKPNASVTWATDDTFKDDTGKKWRVVSVKEHRHLTTHAWELQLRGSA